MSLDPNYLQHLQAQGNAQGLSQLRTLALECSSTLAKFPRAEGELDALLHEQAGVDYSLLAERVERQLSDLTALEAFIDLIPQSSKTKPKTNAILEGAYGAAGLRTAASVLAEVKRLLTEEDNSPREQARSRTISNLRQLLDSNHFRFVPQPDMDFSDKKYFRGVPLDFINTIQRALSHIESTDADQIPTTPDPQHTIHNLKQSLQNPYFMYDCFVPKSKVPVRAPDGSYTNVVDHLSRLAADTIADLNIITSS